MEVNLNLRDLKDSPLPKYYQIKALLLEYIKEKRLKIGDSLPSENKLSSAFGVTKVTASRALNELVSQGVLYRIQGKGTFVASVDEDIPNIYFYIPLTSLFDPYFTGQVINFFAQALAQRGYLLIVKYFPIHKRVNLNLRQQNVGAIVVMALTEGECLQENFSNSRKVPLIYLSSHPKEQVNYIAFANEKGANKAMDYLITLGHRRIAFFSGPKENISNQERRSGYFKGLQKNGLPLDNGLIFAGDYSEKSGYQAAQRLLQMKQRPTAILCANDLMALGAMRAFREMRLKVPEEISIIGFGDFEVARYSQPLLTTVSLPVEKMGRRLAKLTIARIENKENFKLQRIILPTELIVRKSTGKIRVGINSAKEKEWKRE